MLKTGLIRPLLHEILDKFGDCERRMGDLFIDSASDENVTNFPIETTYQEKSDEVVYLSRTIRSKLDFEHFKDTTMTLGRKVLGRKKERKLKAVTASLTERFWK